MSNLKVPVAQKPSKAESLRVEEFKAEKYEASLPAKTRDGYVFPSVDLLDKSGDGLSGERENYEERMSEIVKQSPNSEYR